MDDRRKLLVLSLTLAVVLAEPVANDAAAQVPTLEEPVTTAFGTYSPTAVAVQPDALWCPAPGRPLPDPGCAPRPGQRIRNQAAGPSE